MYKKVSKEITSVKKNLKIISWKCKDHLMHATIQATMFRLISSFQTQQTTEMIREEMLLKMQ